MAELAIANQVTVVFIAIFLIITAGDHSAAARSVLEHAFNSAETFVHHAKTPSSDAVNLSNEEYLELRKVNVSSEEYLEAKIQANVSIKEYMKLRKQLQSLNNKPAVKTIKKANGAIIDCVDLYKMSAFHHPLLNDRKSKMQGLERMRNTSSSDGGCPQGTVPIQRTQMQDLLKSRSVLSKLKKGSSWKKTTSIQPDGYDHLHAYIETAEGEYYGTAVEMNVWTPFVRDVQFSRGHVWISSGQDDDLNRLEFGWEVYPDKYHDFLPHFYVRWTADNYRATGCHNLECPGFTSVNPDLAPGFVIRPSSTYNDNNQTVIKLIGFLDAASGQWWLGHGDYKDPVLIGNFDASIFTTLKDKATRIAWGGEAAAPGDAVGSPPQMGSGHSPHEGYGRAAFMRRLTMLDRLGYKSDAPLNLNQVVDDKACYDLLLDGPSTSPDYYYWGRYFYFGGPGCQTYE